MSDIILKQGGNWTDAYAEVINVPDGFDVEAAYKEYTEATQHTYVGLNFREWLISNKSCTYSDLEVFWMI